LDNGLKVHYHVELEGNTSGDQIDESYLTLTGSFGQFLIGSENSAAYKMGYAPKQFGITTISGDDSVYIDFTIFGGGAGNFRTPFGSAWVEVDGSCNDDKRLTYFTPRFSGFQFGVSYTPSCGTQDGGNGLLAAANESTISNIVSIGANYSGKFDQVSIKVSGGFNYGEKPRNNTGSDPTTITFGTLLGFGGFSLGGYYGKTLDAIHSGPGGVNDNDNMGYAVGLAYETGPWGVNITWKHGEREGTRGGGDDELDTIHLGAQYKLGPGVALKGTIAYANLDDETGLDDDGFYVVGGIKVSF
jgi:predicted porin